MSEWQALIGEDFYMMGVKLIWRRELHDGAVEYSDGKTTWRVQRDDAVSIETQVEPLLLRDDMGRALLAALLRHYNGADDARMLRKDYDAERARVDRLTETVSVIARAGR